MPTADPTTLLMQWRNGDRAALDALFPVIYEDLRRRARGILRHESPGHTLSTTALVHESYLKLIDGDRLPVHDRAHFLAVAARAMRQVLISYARRHQAAKRGGGMIPLELEESATSRADDGADRMLELDRALEKLAAEDDRLARTVEMRFFGGMTVEEIAQAQDRAPSTVKLDWQKARAWLAGELG